MVKIGRNRQWIALLGLSAALLLGPVQGSGESDTGIAEMDAVSSGDPDFVDDADAAAGGGGGTAPVPMTTTLCPLDLFECPGGVTVGRVGEDCEFEECPTGCQKDLFICPNGQSVGRVEPDCEFEECPEVGCPLDLFECPNGETVGRVEPDCEFEACPTACSKDLAIYPCSDGKVVGRSGPDCQFVCSDGCVLETQECPDGSIVGNIEKNCEFEECPEVACPKDLATYPCSDGEFVGRSGPDCQFICKDGCVLETKECPDGSIVGNIEKKCEFEECPEPDNAKELFDYAVDAVGGVDALVAMKYLQIHASGETATEFENTTPEDIISGSNYERNYTFGIESFSLLDYIRVDEYNIPLFENFFYTNATETSRLVMGNKGEQVGSRLFIANGTMISESVASLRRQQKVLNPHFLLMEVMGKMDEIKFDGVDDNGNGVLVVPDPDDVWDFRVYVDLDTGFINKITTRENHFLIRDRRLTYRFFNWDLVTDKKVPVYFPRRVRVTNDEGEILWDEQRSKVAAPSKVDEAVFSFTSDMDTEYYDAEAYTVGTKNANFIESFWQLGFSYPMVESYFPAVELVADVYLLPSGTNSMVIKHSGGVIVVEAPRSEFQAMEIMTQVEELAPGSPITHIIQSHHHVDHSSGVREFLAVGATLVVGDGVEDFWTMVAASPSRIQPDTLSRMDIVDVDIVSVGHSKEQVLLEEEEGVKVTAYHTTHSEHAEDMILVGVVNDGQMFLYEADFYNAGYGGTVVEGGPSALFEAMRDHDIIDKECRSDMPLTIIPAHGFPFTLEEAIVELESLGTDLGC